MYTNFPSFNWAPRCVLCYCWSCDLVWTEVGSTVGMRRNTHVVNMAVVQPLGFTTQGEYFAFCSPDGTLKIYDTATSTLKQEYTPSSHLSATCSCLAWSPGKRGNVGILSALWQSWVSHAVGLHCHTHSEILAVARCWSSIIPRVYGSVHSALP